MAKQSLFPVPQGDFEIKDGVLVKYRGKARDVQIPNGVTSIGEGVFSVCFNLSSITLPAGLTSIGDNAFLGCESLSSIILPESLTSIGRKTFFKCVRLYSITLPGGLSSIGDKAFSWCDSLTAIQVDEANRSYAEQDGVLFNKTFTELIRYPEGKTTSSYIVPDGITTIGDGAFAGCENLVSITLPTGLAVIGSEAFSMCRNLSSITLPENRTAIRNSKYQKTMLKWGYGRGTF
jgi:hypothetical protein